jgi:hypothetical protein
MLELYPPDELLIVAPKDQSMPEMGLNAALAGFETTPRPRVDFDDSEVRSKTLASLYSTNLLLLLHIFSE